jgi:hypothetical protein
MLKTQCKYSSMIKKILLIVIVFCLLIGGYILKGWAVPNIYFFYLYDDAGSQRFHGQFIQGFRETTQKHGTPFSMAYAGSSVKMLPEEADAFTHFNTSQTDYIVAFGDEAIQSTRRVLKKHPERHYQIILVTKDEIKRHPDPKVLGKEKALKFIELSASVPWTHYVYSTLIFKKNG